MQFNPTYENVTTSKRLRRRTRFTFYEPDIPVDYTEHGCEKGAKIGNTCVENSDLLRVFNNTKQLNLEDSLAWVDKHEDEFDVSTVIIDTDDGRTLSQYKERKPKLFILKRQLNQVRHLNILLNCANEELPNGGYLWCHCRTAVLKKILILEKYPKIINWIIYLTHYLWHRVMPKLSFTKGLYFHVTKGKRRTYNRVEVLGRMYRAGFEVIDEDFRHGQFFVLVRKVKAPIWNDTPTSGPLIKLKRVGKDGKIINVYKFRTMYSYSEYLQPYIYKHNALQDGGKFADDYRVNFWGKILRKIWLDELPMILNVLKGEMKLVGVRPLSQHYFSLYTTEMQALRVKAKPGLLPPFYYDKQTPRNIVEVQVSEQRYIEAYLMSPFLTDWRYFWGTFNNIIFRGRRSE